MTNFKKLTHQQYFSNLNSHTLSSFMNVFRTTDNRWANMSDERSINDRNKKIKFAEGFENLLLMIIGALYMLKEKYTIANPIVAELCRMTSSDCDAPTYKIAGHLLRFSYLRSSYYYEQYTHDYDLAYQNLEECVNIYPDLAKDYAYCLSMSRVCFYRNMLSESKEYTENARRIKGVDTSSYLVNIGFFYILENKVGKFCSAYKKLMFDNEIGNDNNMSFSIAFLAHEKAHYKCKDISSFQLLIDCAIAFLTIRYIDVAQGINKVEIIKQKYTTSEDIKTLNTITKRIKSDKITLASSVVCKSQNIIK